MMANEAYRTVLREGVASFVEKKSEFIGYAKPCANEEQALAFLAEIRKKHADARHNVYAYRTRENNIMRYSDDGEPQGSAGVPVLDIIRKNDVYDVCIVVTRYFGGILLGTGGLCRAYGNAAKLALEDARVVLRERFITCDIICDYTDYEKIRIAFRGYTLFCDGVDFTQDVTIHTAVRAQETDALIHALCELTNGAVLTEITGERFDFAPESI